MKKAGRVVCGVLAAAMLTACGTSAGGSASSGAEEITVMVYDRGDAANGTTIEDNSETKWIQEQVEQACGVKVNFQAVSRSTSDDNIQMMMAGNTAPDIIMTYDKTIFTSFAKDGGLAELSEAIETYGPNIKEQLGEILPIGYVEDGQYAIMAKREWQKGKHTAMIRKDWLDAMGMEVPTTKEELIECLYAMKEQDPGTLADFNLANAYYPFYEDPLLCALSRQTDFPSADQAWLEQYYEVITSDLYDDPVIADALEAESTYSANVQKLTVGYAYNLISCAPDQFDAVQAEKYAELQEAGLDKILEETRTYYNENIA